MRYTLLYIVIECVVSLSVVGVVVEDCYNFLAKIWDVDEMISAVVGVEHGESVLTHMYIIFLLKNVAIHAHLQCIVIVGSIG